jgi:hypothetical protein
MIKAMTLVRAIYNTAKQNKMSFIETSALTDNNIALVFETICRNVLKNSHFSG